MNYTKTKFNISKEIVSRTIFILKNDLFMYTLKIGIEWSRETSCVIYVWKTL